MAKGNCIVVEANPRGKFCEGIVSGTPYPGTIMQIKAATEPVGGRFTYEAYNRDADGNRPQGPLYVLCEDKLQGKAATAAYADGDRCFLYCPLAGDELNVLVSAAGTSTGDSQAIGGLLIVNDGDGTCVATTGSPESEPFVVMETTSDVVAAGTLTWVRHTGY
ncbi:hypothetical protein M0R72_16250 [Candidatus Pacearchaeota archaeon]|jgi:hypothetical protein|nr:hypothetical protein [Candidatus Pacearchaeota archaeon]